MSAAEASVIGFGGVSIVTRATGVSRRAIRLGSRELKERWEPVAYGGRVRRPGGGRKRTVDTDPTLKRNLERLVEPTTRGDPESPLRWICKSVRRLAGELRKAGHLTSHRMVAELLHELGYSLQANSKTIEGASHPDRNVQFEYINRKVKRYHVHEHARVHEHVHVQVHADVNEHVHVHRGRGSLFLATRDYANGNLPAPPLLRLALHVLRFFYRAV